MLEDRVQLGVRVLGLRLEDLDLAEELFRAFDLARRDDATRAANAVPVKPVLTRGKRRLVELSVFFSPCDAPL